MTRCATHLSFAVLAFAAAGAAAQNQVQRNFPATALRGELTVIAGPEVRLNGRAARLAPGARIRDGQNLLVLSAAIAGSSHPVNYTVEPTGLLLDVWLLRPDEKKRQPWPRSEAEARAWSFDPVGQRWSK